MLYARKLTAALCIAVILLGVLSFPSLDLPWAILAPQWLFLAFIVAILIRGEDELCEHQPVSFLSVGASRAPPNFLIALFVRVAA